MKRIRRRGKVEQPSGGTPAPDDAASPGTPAAALLASAASKPSILSASWRYGLVGAAGILVNLAVLHVLHVRLGLGFLRSSAVATEVAIVWNYLGNELWTFHHRQLAWRRLVKFNAAALAGLVATVAVANVVKEVVHPLVAQTIGILVGAGFNLALNFWWTWRR